MRRIIRNIFIILVLIIFALSFSRSYSTLNIDNLAYVLAIAVDSAENNELEVTFQFSKPVSPESSSTESPTPILNTVTASSLSNAINLVNGYLGKHINLSHCKIIIFSEEIASKGIGDEIFTLINDTQIRPSANIVVSKCTAKYYLEETKPELENLISKYYEIFTNSSETTGYIPDATIGYFFNALNCRICEPFAILGGVNKQTSNSSSRNVNDDSGIKAGESTVNGENSAENIGVGVFAGDKFVGELNASECVCLLNILDQIDQFLISVPDPSNKNNNIDLYLSPTTSPKIKVDNTTKSPYIKLKFKFSGRIYSMSEDSKYLSPEVLESVSNSCNSYLENLFTDYLYKTSKELKSDINALGKYAPQNFLNLDDFINYNWLESYKDSFFDVEVDTSVKSAMLITQTQD